MFRTLSRLLFGGEEETPEAVDVVEEGWLVVSHQEAGTTENQDLPPDSQQADSAPHGDTVANIETSVSDPEATVQTSPASASFSQPKALTEAMQSACIQKAKALADRHHVSRNAIQRLNRVRQGVQHPSFHLQQPGHRNLSH
ncbi:tumor protein p53-inducible nuclear protein 2 [Betta splendens]|uniref:Tumor protein p53-inducible nuclear protein 2 n=1 Tax=Betta splendens TaxID=158456 RepID=A0A8M1HEJ3_BETSP|nr:tumor protein p53-inducible nuclear protein 2 [Betta splendens]XP_040926886.1 tumor protein p53-inducible nuclear protein 2 [Betta splendens]XP_055365099.1 tumor protein p53-inducible nuclear protein 2 [Betta splendens]